MKLSISFLLISAAIATVASVASSDDLVDVAANVFTGCADCTQADSRALEVIIAASANHYSKIAHVRLDNLMKEASTASVTDGAGELPKEKALFMIAVQTKINDAKIACQPHTLAPAIRATIQAHPDLNIPWFQKDEVERKMADLNLVITNLVLDRIQVSVNAELLSKSCTEKMTNTEIVPAPVTDVYAPVTEAPAPVVEAPAPVAEASASIQEAPAPVTDSPGLIPEAPTPDSEALVVAYITQPREDKPFIQAGIDVAADVDPKFVCKTGCKDSKDANVVLSLRVNLEKEFEPLLEHFYKQEAPAAYNDERSSLLEGVLGLLSNLSVNVDAKARA